MAKPGGKLADIGLSRKGAALPPPDADLPPRPPERAPAPGPHAEPRSTRTVSLTVKVDEDLYRKLLNAGMPSESHPRRRSNQEMVVEALRGWLDHQ